MIHSLSRKRIGIVGIARSGLGAAKLVHRLGGTAFLSDLRGPDALRDGIQTLRDLGFDAETGGHRRIAEEPFDLIVLSPGVVPKAELLQAWSTRSIPVISELEFAARVCDEPWIGVTGSNGKTTTVHLIAHILKQAGQDAKIAGNVGNAWSDALARDPNGPWVVEVSSFQLEYSPTVHPRVGVILNIFENHLDRHASIEEYTDLKFRLLGNQDPGDYAVLNQDDQRLNSIDHPIAARRVAFGSTTDADWRVVRHRIEHVAGSEVQFTLDCDRIPLLGRHNHLNAAAAAAAARSFGADFDAIERGLCTAQPVEHRVEPVRERNGIKFVNDSKSTNLTATIAALDAIEGNTILLFGGRPKKESFARLAGYLDTTVRRIIVFGEARPKLLRDLEGRDSILEAADLAQALASAMKSAQPGDTILLSPGCASFDQFTDYEQRGRAFKQLVQSL